MMHNPGQALRACPWDKPLHLALYDERQDVFFPQSEGPQNNKRYGNNRAKKERPHKNTALAEKSGDAL